jgi:putative oxidoreductase
MSAIGLKKFSIAGFARILLGGLFVYSGVTKLMQPLEFARNIAAYELLPFFANVFFAATLPYVEVLCGLLLVIGWKARPAAAMVVGMMVAFILALTSAMARGLVIDCGCFQVGVTADPPPLWTALIRDLGLLMLSIAVWMHTWKVTSEPSPA